MTVVLSIPDVKPLITAPIVFPQEAKYRPVLEVMLLRQYDFMITSNTVVHVYCLKGIHSLFRLSRATAGN